MTTLRITVEWLDARYHGREWPPAPFRLYQAMVAGCAPSARGDPALEAAMRHLETLPPPAVTAPPVDARTEATAAVPNNDADAALALHAKGKPALARTAAAKALTRRTRRARCVEGAVDLRLACNAPDGRTPPGARAHRPQRHRARARHRPRLRAGRAARAIASACPGDTLRTRARRTAQAPRALARGVRCASDRRIATTARASAPPPSPRRPRRR